MEIILKMSSHQELSQIVSLARIHLISIFCLFVCVSPSTHARTPDAPPPSLFPHWRDSCCSSTSPKAVFRPTTWYERWHPVPVNQRSAQTRRDRGGGGTYSLPMTLTTFLRNKSERGNSIKYLNFYGKGITWWKKRHHKFPKSVS